MKYRILFLIFVTFLATSSIPFSAHAQTNGAAGNLTYTLLAPLPCIVGTGNTCAAGSTITSINIQTYASYIFKFLIALAIFLTIVRVIWGGFKYMTVESVTGKSDAKEIIMNAMWGLLWALASYLILYTIDPRLVSINLISVPPLTTTAGGTVAGLASSIISSPTPTPTPAASYTPTNFTNVGVQGASPSTPVASQNPDEPLDDPNYYNNPDNNSPTPAPTANENPNANNNNATNGNTTTGTLPSEFVSDTNPSALPSGGIILTPPPQPGENGTGSTNTNTTANTSANTAGTASGSGSNSTSNNNNNSPYGANGVILPPVDASAGENYNAASANITSYYQQAVSLQDPSQVATALSAMNAIYSNAISQLQSQNDVVDVANLQFQENLDAADINAYSQQLTLTQASNANLTPAQWQAKQAQVATAVQAAYNQMAQSATSQYMSSKISSYSQARIAAISALQYNNWNNVVPQ